MKALALGILLLGAFGSVQAQFTNYTMANSDLPSDYVCGGVAIDQDNNVWVGTDAGVAKFDGTNWTVYTTTDGLPSNIISCVAVDLRNNVWIGTDGDGVAKFNGSTWTKYAYADGLCDNGIHYMACDADTSMWFGSWGAGVSRLSGSTWTTFNASNGFPSADGVVASVYYIAVDGTNNKWFGTDLGLVKYNNTNFDTINQINTPDLLSNFITSVTVDENNNKWLGVLSKGVAKLNSSNGWVANYDTTSGICNNGVNDIKIGSDGTLWLGEYTIYGAYVVGGITKFDASAGTGVSYDETDGLVNEQVFRIALDENDDLWIATGGGLSKLHDAIGIKENNAAETISLYPNPAGDFLKSDCSLTSGVARIYDLTGRTLSITSFGSPMVIDVKDLTPGRYFITLTGNDKIYNSTFLKN